MIEKRITHQLLEAGELVLTQLERANLNLPEHSTTIDINLDGETFHAQWSGRSRQLTGDLLTERLQDYGQNGGLMRLRLVDGAYRLTLLPPGTPLQITQVAPPPRTPAKTAAEKKARRRATVDRQFHSDDEYEWVNGASRTIGFLTEARNLLGEQLKAAGFDPLEIVELRLQGEELATLDDFEELLAVDVANVDRMPHQEAVARHALSRLRGRAVLADEVGLGKTIEAGLAIKELTLRGLAKRVLVLCPATLRDQWREEMSHKFDLTFDVAYRGPEIANQDKLILSLQLGAGNLDKLTKKPWDIVIVDEAHRAAGAGARKRRELITALTTACRYAFFLTATPVQNDLLELYRLVELLRPGTFTSVSEFRRQYMRGNDPRRPNDPAALRRLISSAMIRTTRAQAGVDRVVRRPQDVPVDLGARERELYALSTDLLRHVMRDSSDTMRRRSLALRLTASPFSMGTTAFRMAERHGDERVRRVLNEVGHLAMDITESARENKALEITRNWIREHGRVLIFTQHTDTVTGLLRRMESDGLTARSFHGSMSATERAATIAAFKSGDAPIMISTDAGAEGQNLQFCNCVLNYDLPWNPMRIEQRIGRVDRLTQPRDEVFIANLYARGTIDESVYRLLAEKLRMFELLFGQVTTILGELDESKTATFETRVLEALFAENDSKMGRLLAELGTELVVARERASNLIAADSGLSSWMSSATDHRKGLTKAGSAELMPAVSERARMRQRRVQAWVRSVIKACGAQVLHDTGEHEGAFITVQFDEEFEVELGGRTLMHLAFDRYGLEHHPDAELCAVGSPVFDELLGLLRMRGDLHATIPVVPDDPGPSPYRHAPSTTLVRRRLVPSGKWSGHATFRATVGEAETTEHVLTASFNDDAEVKLPRRPLRDGEVLPAALGDAFKVVAAFENVAAKQLEALRRERSKQVELEQSRELDRIRSGYTAQIAEASQEDKARLRRALSSEERRLSRQPDVRARAKLLALTLDENDWQIEETWLGPNGVEGTITYEWGLSEPLPIESDASQELIQVLALCAGAHWVDETEVTRCDSCGTDLCKACGDEAVFEDCPICGLAICGRCRSETGGLCRRCGSPERAPELDQQFAIAWRLNRELTLLVGELVAELTRPSSMPSVLVRDEDLGNRDRIQMRAYAMQNGLPADSGLSLRELDSHPESPDSSCLRLHSTTIVNVELSVGRGSGSTIDARAVSDLPDHPTPSVAGEQSLKLGALLAKLRNEVPPPSPPTVVLTRRSKFTDTYLEADRLVEQVSIVGDDGTLETIEEKSAPLRWKEYSVDNATLGEGDLGGVRVTLRRRNDAVLISAHREGGSSDPANWIALPDDASAREQLAWFDVLFSFGMPGGRVGRRTNEAQEIVGPFPSPSECELVERTVHPVAQLVAVDTDSELAPANEVSLAALGARRDVSAQLPESAPTELSRALLGVAERSFTTAVCNGFEVKETWCGHGTASHEYRAFDGEAVAPKLDDVGFRGTDFGICREGHFYGAGTAALCASCGTWACRACDAVGGQASIACPGCSAFVCRRCLDADHEVRRLVCVLCGDKACFECGRDPKVDGCAVCDREVCAVCRVNDLCPSCSQLTPATDEQKSDLPQELALAGASVLIGSDKDATTILLERGDSLEQAVVRAGAIDGWVAFNRSAIDDAYRLRLSASRELATQVIPAAEPIDSETLIDEPHFVVESRRSYCPAWSVDGLGLSGHGTESFTTPTHDLAHLVASAFPALTRLPQAVTEAPRQVVRAIAAIDQPLTNKLEMRWERSGRDFAVTASGLRIRTIEGSEVHETQVDWAVLHTTPAWVSEDWEPVPTVRAHVATDGAEVVIAEMASLLALGVRLHNRSDWHVISASPHAAAATALTRSMGLGDADNVGIFTDPTQISLSTVTNAAEGSLSIRPIGTAEGTSRRYLSNVTKDALMAWMPTAKVKEPELKTLPHNLRSLLEQQFRTSLTRTTLDIGADVEELVTVELGHVWRHKVKLKPGQKDARRMDSTTQAVRSEGALDREGHFVAPDGLLCPYCGARVCEICANGLISCDCCDISICRRCVKDVRTDVSLCPACTALRVPARSEARKHGRWLSTRGMLIGADEQHEVVVEQAKEGWTLHAQDGEKHGIANSSMSGFLSECLGN